MGKTKTYVPWMIFKFHMQIDKKEIVDGIGFNIYVTITLILFSFLFL